MITYETLQMYLAKVEYAFREREKELVEAKAKVRQLELDVAAVNGQIQTLNNLIEHAKQQETTLPMVGDDKELDELLEKRLDFFDGYTPEGFQQERQETVYKPEAMEVADAINDYNDAQDEDA